MAEVWFLAIFWWRAGSILVPIDYWSREDCVAAAEQMVTAREVSPGWVCVSGPVDIRPGGVDTRHSKQ
jgi:hypothetical protein